MLLVFTCISFTNDFLYYEVEQMKKNNFVKQREAERLKNDYESIINEMT